MHEINYLSCFIAVLSFFLNFDIDQFLYGKPTSDVFIDKCEETI